jgi:hypothetical protein
MGLTLTLPVSGGLRFEVGGLTVEEIPHRWVLGSHGNGAHCPDCLELEGEVRTLDEWQNSVMPGSDCLQCGSRCNCSLEPTISLPTMLTICLVFGLGASRYRSLIFQDDHRQWRSNFTLTRNVTRPATAWPGQTPAASLPRRVAAERRHWWDEPAKPPAPAKRRPVHGVD